MKPRTSQAKVFRFPAKVWWAVCLTVVVLGTYCAYSASRYYLRRQAVQQIWDLDGVVSYRYKKFSDPVVVSLGSKLGLRNLYYEQRRAGSLSLKAESAKLDPRILTRLTHVDFVKFSEMDCADLDCSWLQDLPNLEIVVFSDCTNVDATLPQFAFIPSLVQIAFWNSQVTAPALKSIAGHDHLQTITLNGMTVDREMFRIVATLPKLECLDLTASTFASDDLKLLSDHPKLESRSLMSTPVSDQDVDTLIEFLSLRNVHYDEERFSAKSLETLECRFPSYPRDGY